MRSVAALAAVNSHHDRLHPLSVNQMSGHILPQQGKKQRQVPIKLWPMTNGFHPWASSLPVPDPETDSNVSLQWITASPG